jgi:chorismate dehydratase
MSKKLVIGRIPYANVFPIFYVLDNEFDCSQYTFVEGVPSRLNRMLREGEVDISPSSSIEYLRNPGRYQIISNHSISSMGPVGSIFLFSHKPVEDLEGAVVFASSQSETSVALLKIVLKRFYGLSATVEAVPDPIQSGAGGAAFLLIGDDALRQQAVGNSQQKVLKQREAMGKRETNIPTMAYSPSPITFPFVYDLGEIWYRQTGLPFVFALWIVRKDIPDKKELVDKFTGDLDRAKESALKKLPEIARYAPIRSFMTEEDVLSYWKKLDYELSVEHRKGLALFDQYRKEVS